jgi:hypothetical protein
MDAKLDSLQAQRRQFNRKLVLLVHVLAAFSTGLIYLSEIDLSRLPYWRKNGAAGVLFIAAPALLPYIISAVHSWRTATYNRLRVFLFLLVLLLGAVAVGCTIVGAFDLPVDRLTLMWIFAIQAAVYFFAAEFLFDVDDD